MAGRAWHLAQLVPVAIAASAAAVAWLGMEAWDPDGRGATLLAVIVLGALATALYAVGVWVAGAVPPRSPVAADRSPA